MIMLSRPKRIWRILAFDPNATRTGYAWYEIPGPCSSISIAHFDSEEGSREERMRLISDEIKTIVSVRPRPDIIIWESAYGYIKRFSKRSWAGDTLTPNASQLMLAKIEGKLEQVAIDYGIPFESVAPSTWRAELYGKGGGKLSTKEAKARAMEYCALFQLTPANHDAAEAACIAMWAEAASQTLKLLIHNEEKAA